MSDTLEQLSDDLVGAVERASPSVVRVEARRRLPATGVIWSSDGVIVTAHHVVERDEKIVIGLPDGAETSATVVGRDPTTDLAALRVEASDLAAGTWTGPGGPRVGHLVLAVGRPSRAVAATLGIVSAVGDAWRTPAGGRVDRYIQSDATMYPGFSGGPLVDSSGRSLGVTTSAVLRGVTLAIPVETVRRVVEALLSHGRIRSGYLGVGAQPVRLPAGLTTELDQETGLLLASVEAGGPAERAGLLLGDTLVEMDGQRLRQLDDLLGMLGGDRVGADISVKLVRGGSVQGRTVVVGERG